MRTVALILFVIVLGIGAFILRTVYLAGYFRGIDPKFDLTPFELDRFARKPTAGEANVV